MRKTHATILLALSIAISGCAMTSLSSVEQTEKARHYLKSNSMIFGRLVSGSPGFSFSLFATNQESRHIYQIMPARLLFSKFKQDNGDGYFFSFVPPGDYQIKSIGFQDINYMGHIKTDMTFTVPEKSAVYLGTVSVSWTTTKNYLVFQKGNVRYSVRDERGDAFSRIWKRFPELMDEGLNIVVDLIEIKGGLVVSENVLPAENNTFSKDTETLQYQPLTSENINSQPKRDSWGHVTDHR